MAEILTSSFPVCGPHLDHLTTSTAIAAVTAQLSSNCFRNLLLLSFGTEIMTMCCAQ